MKIKDMLKKDVPFIAPSDTLEQAAAKMDRLQVEVMPVFKNNKPLGMLTRDDINTRVSIEGVDPQKVTVSQILKQPY
jgi:predicted transcriptional regulator